jgi:regulatory protein
MKITAIKAQVKNPDRVSIYVDEKYAVSLSYSQVLDFKVRVGLELDEASLDELKKASDLGKAYERALQYVMLRPRSVKELRDYAWRKKWSPEDAETIVSKLVSRGYVNDESFARSWVESRALRGKTSVRKLRLELKQKGITDDIMASAIDGSSYNEQVVLREVIAKKRRLARFKDDAKLMQYLAGQGFSFDDIKSALEES